MNDDDDRSPQPPDDRQLSSPYGPQPDGVDDASGGADSSPFEADSSEERAAKLKRAREAAEKGSGGA